MIRLKVNEHSICVKIGITSVSLTVNNAVRISELDPYHGGYEITPSREVQILQTDGKRMIGNVIVDPIPSNYGLITWNGRVLTVS